MSSSTPQTPTVLLLNLPPKTFVGLDLISFNSSPNFHGIINIPSGFHCLYTGTDASLSIRHCHWLKVNTQSSTQRIYVFRWNHETESLDLLDHSNDTAQAAVRSIPSLQGRGLVDYTALQDASSDLQAKQSSTSGPTSTTSIDAWSTISRHITTRTINRILGQTGPTVLGWTLSSISSAPSDAESIPGLSNEEAAGVLNDNHASALNLVAINLKQTWPEDSIGRDRTEKARDRSWYLGHLVEVLAGAASGGDLATDRQAGAKELLAELQFCFVMVLVLANYSCLEQWKRILSVVFTCKAALSDVEGFFVEIVKVFRAQLGRVEDVEGGLFEMSDEAGSAWLRGLMRTFRGNVDEVLGGKDAGELSTELKKFELWLRETYDWEDENNVVRRGMVDLEDGERVEVQMDGLDEEEETGEYAPVVVET